MGSMDDQTTGHIAAYEERNGGLMLDTPRVQSARFRTQAVRRRTVWSLVGALVTGSMMLVFLV